MKKYKVTVRETGEVLEFGLIHSEAVQTVRSFEDADRLDGIYEPDYYNIEEE